MWDVKALRLFGLMTSQGWGIRCSLLPLAKGKDGIIECMSPEQVKTHHYYTLKDCSQNEATQSGARNHFQV